MKKNAHQKKNLAKVPVWWQEKTANRATFAAETKKRVRQWKIMTIESNAYRLLVEKIEKITAYGGIPNREETAQTERRSGKPCRQRDGKPTRSG